MKNINTQIDSQLWKQLNSQLHLPILPHHWLQLYWKLNSQICSQTYEQLNEQLHERLEEQLKNNI